MRAHGRAPGNSAAQKGQQLLGELGIDLSAHRSRSVSEGLLDEFDLILTMEQGHKEALQIEFPKVANRVYMISEMVGFKYDIEDPMGGSLGDYKTTLKELESIIANGMETILKLTQHEDH